MHNQHRDQRLFMLGREFLSFKEKVLCQIPNTKGGRSFKLVGANNSETVHGISKALQLSKLKMAKKWKNLSTKIQQTVKLAQHFCLGQMSNFFHYYH